MYAMTNVVSVTVTDTLTGAYREAGMPMVIDTMYVEVGAEIISSAFFSTGHTVIACPTDSLLILAMILEGTAAPVYSWNTGDVTPSFLVHSYGMQTVTITDAYGCHVSDSIYVRLDTACAGLSASVNVHFWKDRDTVCQNGYISFAGLTDTESTHHVRYLWDFSASAFAPRFYSGPIPPSDWGFSVPGTFWIKFTAYDSVSGVTGCDSQRITVLPAPVLTSVSPSSVSLGCGGMVVLSATTDLPSSTVEWKWYVDDSTALMATVYGDTIHAHLAHHTYVVFAIDSDGCESPHSYVTVDTLVPVYDTLFPVVTIPGIRDTLPMGTSVSVNPPIVDTFGLGYVTTIDTIITDTFSIDSAYITDSITVIVNQCGDTVSAPIVVTHGTMVSLGIYTRDTVHPNVDTSWCSNDTTKSVFSNTTSHTTISDTVIAYPPVITPITGGTVIERDTLFTTLNVTVSDSTHDSTVHVVNNCSHWVLFDSTYVFHHSSTSEGLGDTIRYAQHTDTVLLDTGVNEPTELTVKIYPNPCFGKLFVFIPYDGTTITICDMTGKTVLKKAGQKNTEITLADFASGVYQVVVRNDHGDMLTEAKIVKE